MTPLLHGFRSELVKLASGKPVGASETALGEALGPLPSMVKGYKEGGWKRGAKSGLGFLLGGGAGALAGWAAASGLHHLVGRNLGWGPFSMDVVLPALGHIYGAVKGTHLAGGSHA